MGYWKEGRVGVKVHAGIRVGVFTFALLLYGSHSVIQGMGCKNRIRMLERMRVGGYGV